MVSRRVFAGLTVLVLLLSPAPWARSFAQVAGGKQTTYAAHVALAQEYLHERRPDLAIPELEAAAALRPGDVQTQANLGVLLFFQGKAAEAIPHLRTALEAQPSLAKIRGILGIAELRTGDINDGRSDLETVFSVLDDRKFQVQVGLEMVSSYTATGDLDRAAAVLAKLKQIAPADPHVLYAAYQTYTDLAGEARLTLALAAPNSAQTHQMLAHEELKEGNTNAAIAEYRKAIALDPHLPSVHVELAELLATSADPAMKAESVAEYKLALADNPQDAKALCGLAQVAVRKGDLQQAFDDYRAARAAEPSDPDASLGMANVLIQRGEQAKALPLLEEAAQLEPTNPTVHYRLAMLYRRNGHEDQAKQQVELFKHYKEMKDKLRVVFQNLLVKPQEIRSDDEPEKGK